MSNKQHLNLPSLKRKFVIDDKYREQMKKNSGAITADNLLAVMSVQTENMANYILDYERLIKEYKATKRHYDVVYKIIYDFLRYDPNNDIVYYDPIRDKSEKNLIQAIVADDDVQEAQKNVDELEADVKMLEEFMKAQNQRAWTCKNILDLLKFRNGEFS